MRTAPVVLPWLLINGSQIYTVHTVANEEKETNELNSAKRKQCLFWNSGCRRKAVSVYMYMFVWVFVCVCWQLCACPYCCLLKRRWKLLNIHGVCAKLGPRDKTFMFWQPERECVYVCVCVCVSVCEWCCGGVMGAAKMCWHQWFNGLNLTWAN